MAIHPNSELLRQTLERLPLLDGRFSGLKLVNVNAADGEKRGCFSLVFRAIDEIDGKPVALKFYDLDPRWRADLYRIASFRREHEILQGLLSAERCVQLASAMSTFNLEQEIDGIPGVTIPCEYFAIEWIDEEIDAYFLSQGSFSAIERLRLFHEIVLSVDALHDHEVFHRDLKPDNLRARAYTNALKKLVVAIDLGTAARFDSGAIQNHYGQQVGAPAYAAPEAICGLAGNRILAPYTDLWALGCLLFELFNPNLFLAALLPINPRINVRMAAMGGEISGVSDMQDQVTKWQAALSRFGRGISPVSIDGEGSWVPKGVAAILNDVLHTLTAFDYRNRKTRRGWVSNKLMTAIRILEHEGLYAKKLAEARARRARRQEVAREKMERFNLLPPR